MSEGPPSPKRLRLDLDDLGNLNREELIEKLREQDDYLAYYQGLQRGRSSSEKDDADDKEGDDKLKQQSVESSRRENTLVLRLTNKEQELQDCLNQIAEMKTAQTQNSAQLRSLLLDPAVNLVFQRMAKEMEDCKEKLKQTQNELSAWKFTADSQMGKRLMAKCRMLLQENEDLGKMISSGRTAKLEAEIALQKTMVSEMKSNQDDMNEFVGELEEDVEGMQSMIYVLQQQLKETKEQLAASEADNARLRTLLAAASTQTSSQPEPGGGGRETTVNSSGGGAGGGAGVGESGAGSNKGGGSCSSDGCEPATTLSGERTSACDVEMSSQQQQLSVTCRNENNTSRTPESLSPRTANTPRTTSHPQTANSFQPTNAVTTQASEEGVGKKSSCGTDLQDLQQPNGRTSEVVENNQHQCSISAAETPDLRTDQTCDRPQTVPPAKMCDDQAADILHRGGGEPRPHDEDVDMKTCNQEPKPVRNGGLEAVMQGENENDEI